MIPVEYFWLMLILVFGIVGMTRGLWKELGVTTILLLSLFVLRFAWDKIGSKVVSIVPGPLSDAKVEALYFIIPTIIIAYISYEGFTLKFPIRQMKGAAKALLGLPGGLLNGYLIIGTLWDVINKVNYFGFKVPLGSSGNTIAISDYLTPLHNTIAHYLPVTFANEFVMLALGMILLLAIVLK